jgi:hypothetical protein
MHGSPACAECLRDRPQNAKKNPDVQHGIKRTFVPLQTNPNVTEFGLTARMDDSVPLVRIPRTAFPTITEAQIVSETPQQERIRKEIARLVILKAWLNHAKRKWSFEWNGIPISAPIIVYVNDPNSFVILKVIRPIPKG